MTTFLTDPVAIVAAAAEALADAPEFVSWGWSDGPGDEPKSSAFAENDADQEPRLLLRVRWPATDGGVDADAGADAIRATAADAAAVAAEVSRVRFGTVAQVNAWTRSLVGRSLRWTEMQGFRPQVEWFDGGSACSYCAFGGIGPDRWGRGPSTRQAWTPSATPPC